MLFHLTIETLLKRCRGTVVCASLLPAALLLLGLGFDDSRNAPFVAMGKTEQASASESRDRWSSTANSIEPPMGFESSEGNRLRWSFLSAVNNRAGAIKTSIRQPVAPAQNLSTSAASGGFCCNWCSTQYEACINNGGDPDFCDSRFCACMVGCGVCPLCQ